MVKVEILEQNGYHFLWIDGYLWMWDVPQEIEDQKAIAEEASGSVLVAGYGLGVVQKHLLENKKVVSVLTVEKLSQIVEECRKTYGKIHGEVVIEDFYKYLSDKKFDCVIGDIWADQSERYLSDYLKFKEKAQSLLNQGGKILGWGKGYMDYLLTKSEKI